MGKFAASIDAGTMGVRCAIFDLDGNQVSADYYETPTLYPKPGWVEQSPYDIIDLAFKAVRGAITGGGGGGGG